MKAEDREELQQNDLATWMYQVPFFVRTYGSYILLAIALVILGWQLWARHQATQEQELQQSWAALLETGRPSYANPPSKLRSIINETSSRPLQAFAYAKLGKFYLEYLNLGAPAEGVQGVKISADQAAKEAQDAFNKVISEYSDQTQALAEARLGLGAVNEDRGQWDQARKQYETILDKASPLADSPLAKIAKSRLDSLDTWSQPAMLVSAPSETPVVTPAAPAATLPATLPATPATAPAR